MVNYLTARSMDSFKFVLKIIYIVKTTRCTKVSNLFYLRMTPASKQTAYLFDKCLLLYVQS